MSIPFFKILKNFIFKYLFYIIIKKSACPADEIKSPVQVPTKKGVMVNEESF